MRVRAEAREYAWHQSIWEKGFYMSPEVLETVFAHYRTMDGFDWIMAQLMLDSDTAVRRKMLDQMGPAEMAVKGGVIMYRRGGGERSGVALQNCTTRRLL